MSSSHLPLVIVGAGPAALTAAIYAARAGHTPVVYTGTEQPGGDLTTTTIVENFPGFPQGIDGPELISSIQEQAERFGADIRFADVESLDVPGQTFTVDGQSHTYDALILTTGSEHRKLGLPGEDHLTGHGVSYCATCDGMFFKGDDVAVVGAGDSAMEEALHLAHFAERVTVLVRGNKITASKVMAERALAHPKLEFRFGTVAAALHEEDGELAGVVLETAEGGQDYLEVKGLFIAIGSDPRTDLVKGQVPVTEHGTIRVVGRTSAVSDGQHIVPGLFAAGDVIDHQYRQAITAAGSGAVAGMDAARYLDELAAAV